MVFHESPVEQQGQYRYEPNGLERKGPARIFPHSGQDGVLHYILTKLRENLVHRGQVSQPWSLLLHQMESTINKLDENWVQITTLLVDFEIFQSGWFNFHLPPNEQFNASFIRKRKEMGEILMAARKAAKNDISIANNNESQRQRFYQEIEKHGRSRPLISLIHQREGGLSDREFARQRLAGQNPMVVRRVQAVDRPILQAWANQPYKLADGSTVDLMQSAIENCLFIADYPLFQDLREPDLQPGKYVGSPVALFHRSERGLEPVLIQLEKGKLVTPTITGGEADDWIRAKLYVQTADVTHHQLIDHLCHTHLAMEAFAIATPRQLPVNHPLYRLLHPHFQFLLAINTRGNTILLIEGAAIEKLMAPTRATSLELMNRAYRQRSFQDYSVPKNIKLRGIEPEFLPEFPYRDDALLLWEAIAQYCTHYLQQHYPDDRAVQQDPYLQAWAAELGAPLESRSKTEFPQAPVWLPREWVAEAGLEVNQLPNHSRVPEFPPTQAANPCFGQLTSLQQLIDIATLVIFTCGPQHAAVNFSQFDYLGYVPNAPMSGYSRPDMPSPMEKLLPPAEQDLTQMEVTFALNGISWGRLGSSELIPFLDKGDRLVLEQFQNKLVEIEHQINARNQRRLLNTGIEYPYLLPSRIPNSINI